MKLRTAFGKMGLPLIEFLSRTGHINLRPIVNRRLGFKQWQNSVVTGENFLITRVLDRVVNREQPCVFFDVGSHDGSYSQALLDSFPSAEIHCFEPNPAAAARLKERFCDVEQVKTVESAISDENADNLKLYDYNAFEGSVHASLYKDVLTNQHKATATKSHIVQSRTIDDYCQEAGVAHINFLKVDVEGHELAALLGARERLCDGSIDLIQFEFNEMNVYSRTFLKDFYDLLPDFGFYRLRKDGLIRMHEYKTKNEVFQFQNILAVTPRFREKTDNLSVRKIW